MHAHNHIRVLLLSCVFLCAWKASLCTNAVHQGPLLLQDIENAYQGTRPACLEDVSDVSETAQVRVSSLWGLWIILACAVVAALLAAAILYFTRKPEQRKEMAQRSHFASVVQDVAATLPSFRHSSSRSAAHRGQIRPTGLWGRAYNAQRSAADVKGVKSRTSTCFVSKFGVCSSNNGIVFCACS